MQSHQPLARRQRGHPASSFDSAGRHVAAIAATLALTLAAAFPAAAASEEETRCAALVQVKLPDAEVAAARFHAAGRFTPPAGAAFEVPQAFCRVEVTARPTASSEIRIELWLPTAARWTGQFWGIGNGSFAGQIAHRSLGVRVGAGHASVATDTGHQADPSDSRWAVGQPEKVVDYGHRAVHLAAVHGKALAAAHFGRPPAKAYFSAYSNGGRQALLLAQRYPQDYDGIVAGAPAPDLTALYTAAADFQVGLLSTPEARLTAAQLERVGAAALQACDSLDGVRDGVIENPLRCRFDPASLACPASPTLHCLTTAQVASVRRLYDGRRPAPGQPAAGRHAPGSERTWHGLHFGDGPGTGEFFEPVTGFFRDLVFSDATWTLQRFEAVRDGAAASRLGGVLDATDPDIRRFVARGGKLILWHGWNDAVVSPWSALDYHAQLVRTLGADTVAKSVRLFMAPGVEHGVGGPGPDRFGQLSAGDGDPERSIGAAMRRWVDEGVAPERVIAVKHRVPNDLRSEVVRSRPLCAWPKAAVYRGEGSTDDAASFDCRDQPAQPAQRD